MFEEIADQAIGPERDVLKNELIEEIEATLREVKEEYGNLLRLKYVEGWKTSAIATLTKMSIKAVESRLVRAKKQFQRLWNYDQKKAKESIEVRNTDRD
jgi:RNA polymerase sigma factor (sigma-70 family)